MTTQTTQKFKPSAYQQAIYDAIANETGNRVVNAVAGSGKTTTIINCLDEIPAHKSVLFLAFNRSIVKELKHKLPARVHLATCHAQGFRVLRNNWGKGVEVVENKVSITVNRLADSWNVEKDLRGYKARVRKLVNFARYFRVRSVNELGNIAERYGVEAWNGELAHSLQVLTAMNDQMKKPIKEIDLVDMVYFPSLRARHFTFPKYDYVFIDECQDLSTAQIELMLRFLKGMPEFQTMKDVQNSETWANVTGRFVAVGDIRQSIYGFAGSNAESFRMLQNLPNTKTLPLSICYRCGHSIISLAQEIIPTIEARPGAGQGVVRNGDAEEIVEGDMVLCRNTAPMISLCLRFLAANKKATIKGQDIGRNLIKFIESASTSSLDAMWNRFGIMKGSLEEELLKKGVPADEVLEHSLMVAFDQKLDCIRVFSESVKTPQGIIGKIKKIFSDDEIEGIIFSTIHKAKGLENDRIFILNAHLMPSPYAKKPWQIEQEENLRYVAYTRAKHELIFIEEE